MSERTVVVSSRIPPSTLSLLEQISRTTKLSVSRLVYAALSQWLRNMPPEMPMEIQIQATRQIMQQQIQVIKDLRWIYYQAEEAKMKLRYLTRRRSADKRYFPRHVITTLKQLERTIMHAQHQLDTWLRQNKRSMRARIHAGDSSEYTTRVAKTVKGARALLEAGFEYVIDMDGLKLFRRRK